MKASLCRYCYKEIKDRDELVTASSFFRIRPFHFVCFKKVEQETSSMGLGWKPLNGPSGTISFFIMFILAIVMLTTTTLHTIGDIIGVLALYPVILRIISYITIERRIPNSRKQQK